MICEFYETETLNCHSFFSFVRMKKMLRISVLSVSVLFWCVTFATAQKPPKVPKNYMPTDAAGSEGAPKIYTVQKTYKRVKTTSMYLTMRDGVKIAVNVVLPADLKEGDKIPAILYQTRYWRGARFNWPFNAFLSNFSGKSGKMMKEVILNGYALIAVDARGSGASTGSRKHPWTEDEVLDGYEIVDWVVKQPWCNGKVGSAGISYSGTTAEFLATTGHPAIKAIAPMFSLYDVYDDIALPGGVKLQYFTTNWGAANKALDNNKLPIKDPLAKMAVGGVQPVKGERKMIKEAVRQHQANLNVADGVRSITYRDDTSQVDNVTSPDRFSPHTRSSKIDEYGVAVYSISGYYDGNYQHAAVKRHLTLQNPNNKLMLGPWEHGGWMNCSPHNPGPSGFSKASELLKFFDYYLKGIDNGIRHEPRVYYYTLGEEKWKSSNVWPPAEVAFKPFYFQEGGRLEPSMPTVQNSFTPYTADTTFGTGVFTRWRSLLGKLKTPYAYHDWQKISKSLPDFSTPPLTEDIEITGHPVVHLYVKSNMPDGAFFVYLQDVDPQGNVRYVTEGQLRAIHRKVSQENRPHQDAPGVPYHSYLKKDSSPLEPGKIELLSFDLYPVSYLFRKGHSIRISISGADKDHFENIGHGAKWEIRHEKDHFSFVELPVMPR
jgi:putative CocE/NonD family hydrolase